MLIDAGFDERLNSPTGAADGQLFTRLAALMVPIPVAKSHPEFVPKAGWYTLVDLESTPITPEGEKQSDKAPNRGRQGTSVSPSVTS